MLDLVGNHHEAAHNIQKNEYENMQLVLNILDY